MEDAESGLQGGLEIGVAAGRKAIDKAPGSLQGAGLHGLEGVIEGRDVLVKADDGETIVLAELAQHKVQGALRLLQLAVGHAARAIDDKDDVLGQSTGVVRVEIGGEEEKEVVEPLTLAGEQASAITGTGGGIIQLKVLAGVYVPGLPAHAGPARAQPLGGDGVARDVEVG